MQTWKGKRIIIIGAARQGTALARYLAERGARVVLNDKRPAARLQDEQAALADLPLEWVLEGHPLHLLDGADLVCPSGGVPLELPLVAEAQRRGIPLSNDSQVFLEATPCSVIGITGSAGKTTTTTLVGRMAEAAVQRRGTSAWVGGNIGAPLIAVADQMQPDDTVVMELSSFQLDIMTRAPQVAAILNITPNHLDRHGTMAAYTAAKANILHFQNEDDVAILGRDDPGAWALAGQVRGRLISFGHAPLPGRTLPGESRLPAPGAPGSPSADVFVRGEQVTLRTQAGEQGILPLSEIQLRGEHNLCNVLAACAIAHGVGLPIEAMRAGVRGFRGVVHRLEFVRELRGAAWYNDSIATAPERAMAGILAFDDPLVLLAGGRDKDLPWDAFADLICRQVKHLVTFGEVAEMVAERVRAVPDQTQPQTVTVCAGLYEAVQAAAQVTVPGDVVLLSPGGTSFDEFRDFAYRGECFKQWVLKLM